MLAGGCTSNLCRARPSFFMFLYPESKIDVGSLIQCLRYKYCEPSRVFICARPLFLSPCRRDGFRARGKTGSCSACVSVIAPFCGHIEGTLPCIRTFLYFPRSSSTRVPFIPPNIWLTKAPGKGGDQNHRNAYPAPVHEFKLHYPRHLPFSQATRAGHLVGIWSRCWWAEGKSVPALSRGVSAKKPRTLRNLSLWSECGHCAKLLTGRVAPHRLQKMCVTFLKRRYHTVKREP